MVKLSQAMMNNFVGMGFDEELVKVAWENCGGKEDMMIDACIQLQEMNKKILEESSVRVAPALSNKEDIELNQAIMASLQTHPQADLYEPLNPEQRIRKEGQAVGLRNVGNTCYFNSLLQSYFLNPRFVKEILSFTDNFNHDEFKAITKEKDLEKYRLIRSVELVNNLQKLFSYMILSYKKYIDPSAVLNKLVDDFGNSIPVGDQRDISEYHLQFLNRVEEVLANEHSKKEANKSPTRMEEERMSPAHSREMLDEKELSKEHSDQRNMNAMVTSQVLRKKEDSVISRMFFGKLSEVIKFQDQTEKGETLFGPIFLDVSHQDLYSAWDACYYYHVDDFKTSNGEVTPAEKMNFLIRPPEVLFFQLKRVIYDVQSGNAVKLNEQFHFEKEIYIDRFMEANSHEYGQIRQRVFELKKQVTKIEQSLQKLMKYGKIEQNLSDVLQTACTFLAEQQRDLADEQDSTHFGSGGSKDIKLGAQILEHYKVQVDKRIADLENRLKTLKHEIEASYGNLRKIKYSLVSILVHDGYAGSGHYYAFINDIKQGKWRRFNDITVTEEKEETVFKESIGGHNQMSAYCLIYMQDTGADTPDASSNNPLRAYSNTFELQEDDSIKQNLVFDMYNQWIHPKVREEVEAENHKFIEEVLEHKAQAIIKPAVEKYRQRFGYVEDYINTHEKKKSEKKGFFPPPIHNFPTFLKSLGNLDDVLKWHLLNVAVIESHPKHLNLDQIITTQPMLQAKLANICLGMASPQQMKAIAYPWESPPLENLFRQFIQFKTLGVIADFLLETLLQDQVLKALHTLTQLISELGNDASKHLEYFSKLTSSMKKILQLRVLSCESEFRSAGQWEQWVEYCMYSLTWAKLHFDINDPFYGQMKTWISDEFLCAEKLKEKLPETCLKNLTQLQVWALDPSPQPEGMDQVFNPDLIPKIPELEDRKAKLVAEFDINQWSSTSPFANVTDNLIQNFEKVKDKLRKWINCFEILSQQKTPILHDERVSRGIDFPLV